MKIAIGADKAGYTLKELIKEYLLELGVECVDYGPVNGIDQVDYPDVGFAVASAIADGRFERGILICGTGIGMTITADKVPEIRAALCHDTYSAERARKSNNAQVLTMGSRVIGPELAKQVVLVWISSEFGGGNSERKVRKIMEGEARYRRSIPFGPDSTSCS